jgi:hypothetical protein
MINILPFDSARRISLTEVGVLSSRQYSEPGRAAQQRKVTQHEDSTAFTGSLAFETSLSRLAIVVLSLRLIKHHATKTNGAVEVQLHAFLTSSLD